MKEKQEQDLEIRVFVEKESRDGPVFTFSMYGPRIESYKGLPIYSKSALEAHVALLAKHVRARMEHKGTDKVCFVYAPPELKDEKAMQEWKGLEELGISMIDPKAAEVIFDLIKKHFPDAEYRK